MYMAPTIHLSTGHSFQSKLWLSDTLFLSSYELMTFSGPEGDFAGTVAQAFV